MRWYQYGRYHGDEYMCRMTSETRRYRGVFDSASFGHLGVNEHDNIHLTDLTFLIFFSNNVLSSIYLAQQRQSLWQAI